MAWPFLVNQKFQWESWDMLMILTLTYNNLGNINKNSNVDDDSMMITWLLVGWNSASSTHRVASLYFSDPHNSWVNFNPLKSVDPCTKKKRGNVLIPLVIPLVITPICARSKAFEAPPRLYRAWNLWLPPRCYRHPGALWSDSSWWSCESGRWSDGSLKDHFHNSSNNLTIQ